jgi:hypothetical protein
MKNITKPAAPTIDQLVNEAITLKLALAPQEARLKELTDQIKIRAGLDTANQVETKSGGKSWSHGDGRGHSIVVSYPDLSRVTFYESDTATLRKLAGEFFSKLFERTVSFKACPDIAEIAFALLPKTRAAKLVDAATKDGSPRVNFELGEGA